MQDKQKLFKDQYDTDVVIDNERGAVVVVEIVDEKLVSPDVNKYIMFALTREQSVKSVQYDNTYVRIYLKEEPTNSEVEEFAKRNRLL